MHSFAPFSSLNFFVKLLRNFRHFFSQFLLFFRDFSRFFRNFAKILPEFLEISRKSIKFANFYEFQGVPDKTRTQIRPETRRRPIVLPLRGAEVLVAVRGPSPGEGGREKEKVHVSGAASEPDHAENG